MVATIPMHFLHNTLNGQPVVKMFRLQSFIMRFMGLLVHVVTGTINRDNVGKIHWKSGILFW